MKLFKFFSPTCGPCKALQKNIDKAGIEVTPIDVTEDENQELVEKYGIRTIPTIIKVTNDSWVAFHGVLPVDKLKMIAEC